ncbi:hypothetical protein [Streptomyces violascens]|uniref:hypothetical protein n=1 Tax=Streptomyces violascens TaxID=67381 RepID=UPI001678BE2C|nr:hypothetical protein [Streptomyces violascens]GGU50985.1 hypothetical protein GCM10010289_84280 [Streptomyces violascens]
MAPHWWALRGTRLPSPATLAAFVRACGVADADAPAWLEARWRAQAADARPPELCLSEGRDTRGDYMNAVAAQVPCAEARPPRTYLRPVDAASANTPYFIEWQHPQHGPGCLTRRREGPGQDLLEPWPWKSCDATRSYQHFRIEPVGPTGTRYRLRLDGTQHCVGLREESTRTGADVTVEP